MKKRLTPSSLKVLRAFHENTFYFRGKDRPHRSIPPTIKEVATSLNRSKTTVFEHMVGLVKLKLLIEVDKPTAARRYRISKEGLEIVEKM